MGFKIWLTILLGVAVALEAPTTLAKSRSKSALTTIIEADHFYSEKQRSNTYNISGAQAKKALVTLLKPKEGDSSYSNPVTVGLSSGSDEVKCKFRDYADLCVLPNVTKVPPKMRVQCEKAPCEVHFTNYQATALEPKDSQELDELYVLDSTSNHTIVMFRCNDPDLKTYQKDIKVYSSLPYQRAYFSNLLFILFKTSKLGYMYVDAPDKAQACTKMMTYKAPGILDNMTKWKDFVENDAPSNYSFKSTPSTNIMVDISVIGFGKEVILTSDLLVELRGTRGTEKDVLLQSYVVANSENKTALNANTVFHRNLVNGVKDLRLRFSTKKEIMVVNCELEFSDVLEVDPDQISYFNLKKGQALSYRLVPPEKRPTSQVEVELLNDNGKIEINKKKCQASEKCQVQLKAKEDVKASMRMKVMGMKLDKYLEINGTGSVTQRIRQAQVMYFMHKAKARQQMQITVNSQNVILYVGDEKCPVPSQKCNKYSGNFRESIIIEPQVQTTYYIAVQSLDDTMFTLRIEDNADEYIQLKDGEPFSYTLKTEQMIGLVFKLKEKADVEFNLIAPLNSLYMYVSNSNILPKGNDQDLKSTDGRLTFIKKDLNSTEFTILVKKSHSESQQKVSFTIIASTNNAIIPLQSAVSHYDTLVPKTPKIYLLNYKRDDTNIVSFYLFGTATVQVETTVKVAGSMKEFDKAETLKIQTTQELLELDGFAADICSKDKKQMCEMYLKLENQKDKEVDLVITHLVQQAIVELKDGVWQSFPLTFLTSELQFYFVPKHPKKSVNIMYNSTDSVLTLGYKLWKTDDKFNPSKWPFPTKSNNTDQKFYNPLRHISISPQNLKDCWPDCLVLLSVLGVDKSTIKNTTQWEEQRVSESFSLMASNDAIELMEHEKIELVLHNGEEKEIFVDLKYFLEKERLTFFSSSTVGQIMIYGVVSSNSKVRIPSAQNADFNFGYVQTQIPMKKIKDKLQELEMKDDKEIYLRLLVIPYNTTKFTIEFTSKQELIRQLRYNTFETVALKKDQQRIFQLVPTDSDYTIKYIRMKGFPYIETRVCDNKELQTCMDEMTLGNQLASKYDEFKGKREASKIVVVKVTAKEPIELDIYTLSMYGEFEIKEGLTITDFSDKGEINRYLITSLRSQETVITVNVMEGDPTVKVWRPGSPIISKKKKDRIIHISIPPHTEKQTNTGNFYDPLSLNVQLQNLHLTIEDTNQNSYYTVGYTAGERGLELQDGMITSAMIDNGKNVTFYYENIAENMQLMAIVSFGSAQQMKHCQIKLSYSNDQNSTDGVAPTIPPVNKKTPNPTMVFQLPSGYVEYEILVLNKGSESSAISVTINQDEAMILPYNMEYPIVLKQTEKQFMIVEVNNQGNLLIIVRKCNEGVPMLAYTFDYQATKKDDYVFEGKIKDAREQIFVKGKIGTLYLRLTADVSTIFSVEVKYFKEKKDIPKDNVKLGNQGIIEYQLINSVDSQISFLPLNCSGRSCGKVKYQYMNSINLQSLYSQLVCPSHFFTFSEATPPLQLHQIKVSKDADIAQAVRFEFRIIDQISYFGIKATLENGREYIYKPVEIVTIWGHIARNKRYHTTVIGLFIGCVLLCICMLLRRRTRGYGVLKEEDDPAESEHMTMNS